MIESVNIGCQNIYSLITNFTLRLCDNIPATKPPTKMTITTVNDASCILNGVGGILGEGGVSEVLVGSVVSVISDVLLGSKTVIIMFIIIFKNICRWQS
jgi:hypothetical protein